MRGSHALILGLVALACYVKAEQDNGYSYGKSTAAKSSFSESSSHSKSDDRHLPNHFVSGIVNTISNIGAGPKPNGAFTAQAGAVNQLGGSNGGQTQGGYWWMAQGSPFKPHGGAATGGSFVSGTQSGSSASGSFTSGSSSSTSSGSFGSSSQGGFGGNNPFLGGTQGSQSGSQESFGGNFGSNIGSAISGAVGQAISSAGSVGGHFGFGSNNGAHVGFGGHFGNHGGNQGDAQGISQGGANHNSQSTSTSHGSQSGSHGIAQGGAQGGTSHGSHHGSHHGGIHSGSHGNAHGGASHGSHSGSHGGIHSGTHGNAHGGASHGSHSGSHGGFQTGSHTGSHGGHFGTSSHGSHSSHSHGSHNSHFESSSSHGSHNTHSSNNQIQTEVNTGVQSNAPHGGYPSIKPSKPFVTGHTISCSGKGKICVVKHQCVNGYVTLTGVSQVGKQNQKCDVASEVCCTLQKPAPVPEETNNGYLPPIGTSPSDNRPNYAYPPIEDDGLVNDGESTGLNPSVAFPPVKILPQLGCAAALICVEEQYCTMTGVISKTPVTLTEQQLLRRVPMVDCRNPDNGVTGKCCRDPDYVDPWPAGNIPAELLKQGFDEQGFPKFLNLTKSKPKPSVRPAQPLQPLRPVQPQQTIKLQPQQPSIGFQPAPQESKTFDSVHFNIAQSTKFGEKIVPAPSQPQTFQPEQPQSVVPERPQTFVPKRPQQVVVPHQPEHTDVFTHQQEGTFIHQSQHPAVFAPGHPEPQHPELQHPEQSHTFHQQKFEHTKVVLPSAPQSNLVVVDESYENYKPIQPAKSIAGLPSLSQIQESFTNFQASNLNPFKPQSPAGGIQQDTEIVSGPVEVPESPLPATTKKPFFSNFPNLNLPSFSLPSLPSFPGFPNQGSSERGRVVESVHTAEAPVILSSYSPGSKCGVVNKVQHSFQLESDETAFGEITWQAMVLNNVEKKLLCSGAIVAPNVVLTAAHCVYGIKPSEVSIKAGEWKLGYELKHEEPLPFEIVRVESIVAHPNYKPGFSAYDTAVLYLESPIRLAQHVDTICVADAPVATPQRKCISTGWGKVAVQYHAAGALMHKIDVDVIASEQCRQRLQSAESQIDIDDSLVCTKAHKQSNNLCQVDVGGPLACERADGSYELVGIYSQDTGCLPTNQVATFALIDSEWVHEMIGSGSRGLEQHPQQTPSRYHYHEEGVPCDCQQGSLPAGSNQYLPPV